MKAHSSVAHMHAHTQICLECILITTNAYFPFDSYALIVDLSAFMRGTQKTLLLSYLNHNVYTWHCLFPIKSD